MASDYPNAIDWPDELAWVIAKLKRERRQDFIETPMEQGPPKRRPANTGYNVLAGIVTLNDKTWLAIESLIQQNPNNLFRVVDPEIGEPMLLSFVNAPRHQKISTSDGEGTTTRETEFLLRIV